MTIALLSDIHANLPALEAVLADIDQRKPDAIYCLGDLIGYNVWPNEVIELIKGRGIATLAGNHDVKVKNLEPVNTNELNLTGKNYAYHLVKPQNQQYLLALPAHIRLTYEVANKTFNLLLVHGSPTSINEYLFEDLPEVDVNQKLIDAQADIICCGHTHLPYQRLLRQPDGSCKQVINIGSVGKPKDGDNRACYVLLHIHPEDLTNLKVEFVRVAYAVELAATAVENSPLPNEFAQMLRNAF